MDDNPEFYYVVKWSQRDGWAMELESRYDEEPVWDSEGWRPVRDDESAEDQVRYVDLADALDNLDNKEA